MIAFDPTLYERDGLDGQRRRQIVALLQAALAAVDPAQAVRHTMRREGDRLYVGERCYDLGAFRRVLVVGTGKAGASMAQAAEDILGVTHHGWPRQRQVRNTACLRRGAVPRGGHPHPGRGRRGGRGADPARWRRPRPMNWA
jgi:glycerate-2-kinase